MKKQKDQSVCSERARLMQSCKRNVRREQAQPCLVLSPSRPLAEHRAASASADPGWKKAPVAASSSRPALGACLFLGPD